MNTEPLPEIRPDFSDMVPKLDFRAPSARNRAERRASGNPASKPEDSQG